MPKVEITLNEKQMEIVDHLADTFGFSRAEAAKHLLLRDAWDWYAKVMVPELRKDST